jgi:hypothetical protein
MFRFAIGIVPNMGQQIDPGLAVLQQWEVRLEAGAQPFHFKLHVDIVAGFYQDREIAGVGLGQQPGRR